MEDLWRFSLRCSIDHKKHELVIVLLGEVFICFFIWWKVKAVLPLHLKKPIDEMSKGEVVLCVEMRST